MLPNNIYFLVGSSCGGKTTAATQLHKKYGAYHYNSDEMRSRHFANAEKDKHLALARVVEDYAALPKDDALQWEKNIVREMTPMMLSDLQELSKEHSIVVCDGDIDIDLLVPLIDLHNIICLTASRDIAKQEFFNRPDHIHMLEGIKSRTDLTEEEKQARIQNFLELVVDNEIVVLKYGIKQYIRTQESTVDEMMDCIERWFCFNFE